MELSDIREHCRSEGLAIQKCPEQLEIVDALPRNAMGKVLKQELRLRSHIAANPTAPTPTRPRRGTDRYRNFHSPRFC